MLTQLHELNGYKAVKYRFPNQEAEERFFNGTNRLSGDIILWDLARQAKEVGCKVPAHLTPRSRYSPEMLLAPMTKYLKGGQMQQYDDIALSRAAARVREMFFVGKLEAVAIEMVGYQGDKNSGAPLFQRKRDVYAEALNEAYGIRNGCCPPPLTVFHRGKNQEVARPVFGYPFSMSLIESRFFEPLQEALMASGCPYSGGKTYTEVSAGINKMRWNSNLMYALDYSGFDGSISGKLTSLAWTALEDNFNFDQCDRNDWEIIKRYFSTAPMLLPDGFMLVGRRHGVPSGSMFTQIIDSVVNCILIEYAKIRLGMRTSSYMVMGDDSIIGVMYNAPSLEKLASVFLELGIHLNQSKSTVCASSEDEVHYLGHYWYKSVLTRHIEETWERILTPERYDKRWALLPGDPIRTSAYIERLRAYQDDNADAFMDIQLLILKLKNVPVDSDSQAFIGSLAYSERTWDPSLKPFFEEFIPMGRTQGKRFLYNTV